MALFVGLNIPANTSKDDVATMIKVFVPGAEIKRKKDVGTYLRDIVHHKTFSRKQYNAPEIPGNWWGRRRADTWHSGRNKCHHSEIIEILCKVLPVQTPRPKFAVSSASHDAVYPPSCNRFVYFVLTSILYSDRRMYSEKSIAMRIGASSASEHSEPEKYHS